MAKRKRTRKQPPKPPSKKRARQKTLLERIKSGWLLWLISLLMVCSLFGRFASSTMRRAAGARSSQPVSTVAAAPARSAVDSTAAAQEDFSGSLVIQGEGKPNQEVSYSLHLPSGWHDKIKTSVQGDVVSFIYDLDTTTEVPIFTLAAYTDSAWEALQAQSGSHGQKLSDKDGVVVVDEIVLDQTEVERKPELKAVKEQLPQILHTFMAN